MNINQDDRYYRTSDLALAVTLSLFLPLETINKIDFNKAVFIFKRDQKLDKLVTDYWQKKLQVEPQTYFQQLRTVKSRLYGEVQR